MTTAHTGPVLDVCWAPDGRQVFSGSCDGSALLWNLETNQTSQVAAHDAPIRAVFFDATLQCLATGSWDSTVKFWDCRQAEAVCSHSLPGRVQAMSSLSPLAVVACSGAGGVSSLQIINLAAPDRIFRSQVPKLPYAVSCVAALGTDKQAFFAGSIEGRGAIHYAAADVDTEHSFSFKCHRAKPLIYAINDAALNPAFGTFATVGQDGVLMLWEHKKRQKLADYAKGPRPLCAVAFHGAGEIVATASGYDWNKGVDGVRKDDKVSIDLLRLKPADVKPK